MVQTYIKHKFWICIILRFRLNLYNIYTSLKDMAPSIIKWTYFILEIQKSIVDSKIFMNIFFLFILYIYVCIIIIICLTNNDVALKSWKGVKEELPGTCIGMIYSRNVIMDEKGAIFPRRFSFLSSKLLSLKWKERIMQHVRLTKVRNDCKRSFTRLVFYTYILK